MSFSSRKRSILEELKNDKDNSPKGTVDAPIIPLLQFINSLEDYVTTSSCSGRHSIFMHSKVTTVEPNSDFVATNSGKGCGRWLLVKHEPITVKDVLCALEGRHLSLSVVNVFDHYSV